jgi:hypothetical protein
MWIRLMYPVPENALHIAHMASSVRVRWYFMREQVITHLSLTTSRAKRQEAAATHLQTWRRPYRVMP